MKYIVIGAGGTGGWFLRGIAPTIQYSDSITDKNLWVVDGDSFEPHNEARQDFEMLGPKPQVRCAELSERYDRVHFTAIHKWVVEKGPANDNGVGEDGEDFSTTIAASDLIEDGDVVVCVVDNFACRATVADAASSVENVDIFLAGNDEEYFGSYYHYQRRDGKDITVNPLWKDELANPTDRNPGEMSCEERARIDGGTQSIWTNMAVAAMVGIKINHAILELVREPDTDEAFFDFELCRASGSDRSAVDETVDEKVPTGTSVS